MQQPYSYGQDHKRPQASMNYDGQMEVVGAAAVKKSRTEGDPSQSLPPSKVLHVRNLPTDIAEHEVMSVALPFGQVDNVLLVRGKGQAFVQMQDVSAAIQLVQYYTKLQASIRGKHIFFQYSQREEITQAAKEPEQQQTPNNILLVTVMNVIYAVSVDTLHQVFSKYGVINKIITFVKKGFQALVEFAETEAALVAKQALENQNIYAGCCTLRIQFSNMKTLNVKYNNEKSRDFTNNTLPSGNEPNVVATYSPEGWAAYGYGGPAAASPYGKGPVGMTPGGTPGATNVLIVNNLDPDRMTPDKLFTLFGLYGDVMRVKILYNKLDTALIAFASTLGAETALTHLNGRPLYDRTLSVNFSKHTSISMPREAQEGAHLTKDFTASPLHRYKQAGSKNFQHICPPCNVLHLSNLPTTDESVITGLFSQFGKIVNFKFFVKDPRMALIEFETVSEATDALMSLHNYYLNDTFIRVSFSKSNL